MSPKFLLLALVAVVIYGNCAKADDPSVGCNQPITNIAGTLSITTNPCEFSLTDSKAFMIETTDLALKSGEYIEVQHQDEKGKPVTETFKAPFNPGYFLINVDKPKITFHIDQNSTGYNVPYQKFIDPTQYPLDINLDVNRDIKIKPYTYKEFNVELRFTKTLPKVHLEVSGATLMSSSIGHALIIDLESKILSSKSNNSISIRTTRATEDCSEYYLDSDPKTAQHQLTKTGERCVWIFRASDNNHFDIDFKDFIDLNGIEDELTIVGAPTPLKVSSSNARDYPKRIISSLNQDLAIFYTSPSTTPPKAQLFQLFVGEKETGGVLRASPKPSPLKPNESGTVRYTIIPELNSYAALEFKEGTKVTKASVVLLDQGKNIATFGEDTYLPPVIALNTRDQVMDLVISSNDSAIQKATSIRSLDTSCNHLSQTTSDSVSFGGSANSTCYWTIAALAPVLLRFENLNLSPNGCLTIQPLDQAKPIYSKCNVTELVTPFALKQAYVKVTMQSPDTRVDASITPWFDKPTISSTSNVSSANYPLTYPYTTSQESVSLNGTYILSVADVDLRKGEKLMFGDKVIESNFKQDIALMNQTVNLTVVRPQNQDDFGFHRGYNLVVSKFDKIIIVNKADKINQINIPQNLSSVYVKISSPGTKVKFGNIIKFNSSLASATNVSYAMKVYDSKTILLPGQELQTNISTSDTIIITYQVTKPGTKLPNITLSYEFLTCGGHVCDLNSRCVPAGLQCKGKSYCMDGSDQSIVCSAGPAPPPKVIETGVSGMTVFVLSVLMLVIGAVSALYGPNLYKSLYDRFRNQQGHQYTSFTSTE